MTNGPYGAMGSFMGAPDISMNRVPEVAGVFNSQRITIGKFEHFY